MIYQNPKILYFLFALAIPIIVHLFNFRKHQKVFFSSNRFLKEVKTQNKKKKNLKNLLILISRLLAIFFLILAFAKPYIPNDTEKNITKKIFIYLDNSFSMNAISENGRLLDIAKNTCEKIINSFPPSTNFYLITNDFSYSENLMYSAENLKEKIASIETSGSIKTISQILDKKQTISKTKDQIYLLSDFQKINSVKIEKKIDDLNEYIFVPIQAENLSNISIDSIWIDGPVLINNNTQNINVKVSNYKSNNEIPITLQVNDEIKLQQLINVEKDKQKTFQFKISLDSTVNLCNLKIEDYPITFDNQLFFNLIKNNKINIVSINQKYNDKHFERLFKNDTINYKYLNQNIANINYENLMRNNVIILNQINRFSSGLIETLKKVIKKGISLIIVPSTEIDIQNYNSFFNIFSINNFSNVTISPILIKQIKKEHFIFKDVFDGEIKNINFPYINHYYETKDKIKTNKKSIYTLENNQDFLSHYNFENSNIFVFNSPLNDSTTNFHTNPLFVPTLLNISNSSVTNNNIYYLIKNNSYFISDDNKNQIFTLKNNLIEIIPTSKKENGKTKYYTNNQIQKAGNYQLYDKAKIIDQIAFNYNSSESNIEYMSIDNILPKSSLVKINKNKISEYIFDSINDKHYWKSCLILSLLFFGIELLLLKLIKT